MREKLLLDLAHLQTPIQSTAVYFRAYTRKSTIHHLSRRYRRITAIVFLNISFDQSTEDFFKAIDKLYGIQREKFF